MPRHHAGAWPIFRGILDLSEAYFENIHTFSLVRAIGRYIDRRRRGGSGNELARGIHYLLNNSAAVT